ncbi:MAG TPA: trypsin-like peptidase domain-containing protein [Haloplasmataceae bacterium]
MKKFLLVICILFTLTGCSFPFFMEATTTEKNLAQLDADDLENIKQQIMNELREEIQNEYNNRLTEVEKMIIDTVKAYGKSVIGVSNYQYKNYQLVQVATGSGVIYKHDFAKNEYYVITNEHVIEDAVKIKVVLEDLTYLDATLIGKDKQTDLAVIKFTTSRVFPTVSFGDSDKLQLGQFAIAIGNPLGYEYYGSVTVGHISGLTRNINIDHEDDGIIDWVATLIQHDAAISPGNSGGALLDIQGRLIGINNMKIVDSSVSEIGFAIPVNTVKTIIEQLEIYGEVKRPSLGIQGNDIDTIKERNNYIRAGLLTGDIIEIPEVITGGVYVDSIVENSSVHNSGLKKGDIITKFNDVVIIDFDDLRLELNKCKIGDEVTLQIYRDGEYIDIEIVLKERPQ